MLILGISAFYHDSAAALIRDGKILFAAQEERFTRIKNDPSFPLNAIKFCLNQEGITLKEVDHIIYYEKPWNKFERLIETIFQNGARSFSFYMEFMPLWLGEKLNFRKFLQKKFRPFTKEKLEFLFSEHHYSHAASSFYTSPFKEACVLTIDGVGESETAVIWHFTGSKYKKIKALSFPHSLGLLYSAFTFFCGFKVNSGEYKLMGLASYGDFHSLQTKKFIEKIENELIYIFEDGSFEINSKYFSYYYSNKMIEEKIFTSLFSIKKRRPEDSLTQDYFNLAFAIQYVLEKIILKIAKHAKEITKSDNLCLSGGVALNCVANAKLKETLYFEEIWIHPSPGDAGAAIGAALGYYFSKNKFEGCNNFHPYLGPSYENDYIKKEIHEHGLNYQQHDFDSLIEIVADELNQNKVIGWFQDAMEWGPRSLGNRSILANPKAKDMQQKLNSKIKFRESFRPFAPIIIETEAPQYFKRCTHSPYMQYTYPVLNYLDKNSLGDLPAITHCDGSARVQTITIKQNEKIYKLLKRFKKKSGVPILINTSFNLQNEPIVCDPKDAIQCFLKSNIDYLVLNNFLIKKKEIGHY